MGNAHVHMELLQVELATHLLAVIKHVLNVIQTLIFVKSVQLDSCLLVPVAHAQLANTSI